MANYRGVTHSRFQVLNLEADTATVTNLTTPVATINSFAVSLPAIRTAATYVVADTDTALIFNRAAGVTVTLPAASARPGRVLWMKTIAAGAVVSNASNVKPIGTDTAASAILAASAGSWAMLVSDGANWVIMAS